ncbi:MAG: hypothetical protein AB1390_06045 [Nitrospirota bacterium]
MQKKIAGNKGDGLHVRLAALLHIYVGALTLREIAGYAGLSAETLQELRANAPFMKMVDTYKKEYANDLREDILVNTYSTEDYDTLASDVALLDEMLRMQIKLPLFTQLRNIAQKIESKSRYNLKIDSYDLMLFRRLFSFLILVEKYATTLTAQALLDMKKTAVDTVWPGLQLDSNEIDQMLERPMATIDERLAELRERLDELGKGLR